MFEREPRGGDRDCTVGYVAVAPVLDDVAQLAFHPLVAGEVQGVSRAGTHHGDVEAPEGPEEALRPDDPPQGLVHTAVLGLGVRLEALHSGLEERETIT